MSTPFERMRRDFGDKEYRHAYADEFLNTKIATQIKVLREQRRWTQGQLAQAAEMRQARISVLEDVNYSSWSIRTLRRLAEAFDLRLNVSFEEFGTLWLDLRDLSRESLSRRSFADDPAFQEGEAEQQQARQTENITEQGLPMPVPHAQRVERMLSLDLTDVGGQQGSAPQRQTAEGALLGTLPIEIASFSTIQSRREGASGREKAFCDRGNAEARASHAGLGALTALA